MQNQCRDLPTRTEGRSHALATWLPAAGPPHCISHGKDVSKQTRVQNTTDTFHELKTVLAKSVSLSGVHHCHVLFENCFLNGELWCIVCYTFS